MTGERLLGLTELTGGLGLASGLAAWLGAVQLGPRRRGPPGKGEGTAGPQLRS